MAHNFLHNVSMCFALAVVLFLLPQGTEAQDGPPNLFQYASVVPEVQVLIVFLSPSRIFQPAAPIALDLHARGSEAKPR